MRASSTARPRVAVASSWPRQQCGPLRPPGVRAASSLVCGRARACEGGGGAARLGVRSACVWLGARGEGTRWDHFPSQPGHSSEAPGTCSRTAGLATSCLARPGSGRLLRPGPWLAGCAAGQEPGWRRRGQKSGCISPRGDRRQSRGAQAGGVGPSLAASSSTGHRFCQKAFRWCADGRASRLPPVTARPRHDLDRTAGRPLRLRPLTSPSRPSLRLARGGGGLADSRRRWCRACLPGGRRGDDVSP